MAEQEKRNEALRKLAAEQGPRWPSRKDAWFDGYREGEMHARLTGQGYERVTQLEEAIREHQKSRTPSPEMPIACRADRWDRQLYTALQKEEEVQ